MSITLFGLGLGVVILSTLWTACLLICLILSRHRGVQGGIVYIALPIVVSITLWLWPKQRCDYGMETPIVEALASLKEEEERGQTTSNTKIDHMAIPRASMAAFLVILLLAFGIRSLKQLLFEPQYVKQLRRTKIS